MYTSNSAHQIRQGSDTQKLTPIVTLWARHKKQQHGKEKWILNSTPHLGNIGIDNYWDKESKF